MADNNVITVEELARAILDYYKDRQIMLSYTPDHFLRFWQTKVHNNSRYSEVDTSVCKVESVQNIYSKLGSVEPNSQEDKDFGRAINLFKSVLGYDGVESSQAADGMRDLVLLVRKFKDQDLAFEILKNANYTSKISTKDQRGMYAVLSKQYFDMLGSNKNAKAVHVAERIWYCQNPDEVRDVISGVFNKVDEEIKAELSRDYPDKDEVRRSTNSAKNVVDDLNRILAFEVNPIRTFFGKDKDAYEKFRDEARGYQQQAVERYNVAKIIEENTPLVIQKFDENLSVKMAEVMTEDKRLTDENGRLVDENKRLNQYNEEKRQEHIDQKAKWEEKFANERAARIALEDLLAKAEAVIAAYEQGEHDVDKAGVFGKGAAKVKAKEAKEKAEKDLKEAKRREAERKENLARIQRAAGQAIEI